MDRGKWAGEVGGVGGRWREGVEGMGEGGREEGGKGGESKERSCIKNSMVFV